MSGYIKNAITEKPESNVVLKIRNKNISTITDTNGYYKMQVPIGINILEIKSLNHKKIVKTITDTISIILIFMILGWSYL